MTLDGQTHELDRARADELWRALDDALDGGREAFVHTVGEHRRSGEYVVERRGANSAGHRKVFPSFDHLQRLSRRLPEEFTAADLTRSGLTGGRRHMVLWHLVEHPAFACELTSRQPLTARKRDGVSRTAGEEASEVGSE